MSNIETPKQGYTPYEQIDQEQLKNDIEAVKDVLGAPNQEDFEHLLKLERWGRYSTFSGYALSTILIVLELFMPIGSLFFWTMVFISAILIGVGNVSRWANVTHPILHGAYDKVPNIPARYTRKGFATGSRRYLDWVDWIKPEAWSYEHNIMHHYHLGEKDDPDNVELNTQWIVQSKMPMFVRYLLVYTFAATWKFTYYAPNTLRVLENKKLKKDEKIEIEALDWSPKTKLGLELWMDNILPYAIIKFIVIPALFLPFGVSAVLTILIVNIIAEAFANLHSFLVIVPNHSAEDIYMFNKPHKGEGEFYLRQIMGSVNYNTGSDLIDFGHGWLNYQIEHHLFPNLPLSQYQKMQPIVKDICKKHNLEYRQESVFKRMKMTIELMVGKTKLLRIDGV